MGWQVRSGFRYADSLSKTQWIRSPLNFSFLNRLTVSRVVSYRKQKVYLLHDTLPHGDSLNFNVTVSEHPTLFMVNSDRNETQPSQHFSSTESTRLSNFNATVDIGPPRVP